MDGGICTPRIVHPELRPPPDGPIPASSVQTPELCGESPGSGWKRRLLVGRLTPPLSRRKHRLLVRGLAHMPAGPVRAACTAEVARGQCLTVRGPSKIQLGRNGMANMATSASSPIQGTGSPSITHLPPASGGEVVPSRLYYDHSRYLLQLQTAIAFRRCAYSSQRLFSTKQTNRPPGGRMPCQPDPVQRSSAAASASSSAASAKPPARQSTRLPRSSSAATRRSPGSRTARSAPPPGRPRHAGVLRVEEERREELVEHTRWPGERDGGRPTATRSLSPWSGWRWRPTGFLPTRPWSSMACSRPRTTPAR